MSSDGFDIERYLNIRGAGSPSFSPGGRLSFLIDTTGVSQVWSLKEPGKWPEQLTFYDEPVHYASWSPEREELIFGMDEGGNERTQLYLLDGEDASVTPLTEEPEAKHLFGGWSDDGERFAFTSNRRDEAVFDVYVQDRDAEEPEPVLEGEGWLSVADWHPSGEKLVISEAASNFDQDLYLLDLEGGGTTHLTPHEDDVRYGSVNFSPDGERIFFTSDEGSDLLYLAEMVLDTGESRVLVESEDWDVEGFGLDRESGRWLYSLNVDGFTDLHVGELVEGELRELPEPDLPRGVYGGASFSPDGERMAVTVTGRTMNPNVFVVELETGEVERWTDASTAGIPRETFVEPETVSWESFDGLEVPGLYSLPHSGEPPYPVVVDVHGGPESQRRPSFSSVKQYLLSNGYAVLEPNVRGSTGYGKEYSHLDDRRKRMDSVTDLETAAEWLKGRGEVDRDRIAVMGGSYGGFMTLAALTEYPETFAAGIDVVGIASFVTFLENTGAWRRELREEEYGYLDEDREFLERISPLNNAEKIRSPLLVLHGANDPRVPVGEAEQIVEEVGRHGVPVEKLIFEDEGHGFSKLENRVEAYRKVVDFLDEHLSQD